MDTLVDKIMSSLSSENSFEYLKNICDEILLNDNSIELWGKINEKSITTYFYDILDYVFSIGNIDLIQYIEEMKMKHNEEYYNCYKNENNVENKNYKFLIYSGYEYRILLMIYYKRWNCLRWFLDFCPKYIKKICNNKDIHRSVFLFADQETYDILYDILKINIINKYTFLNKQSKFSSINNHITCLLQFYDPEFNYFEQYDIVKRESDILLMVSKLDILFSKSSVDDIETILLCIMIDQNLISTKILELYEKYKLNFHDELFNFFLNTCMFHMCEYMLENGYKQNNIIYINKISYIDKIFSKNNLFKCDNLIQFENNVYYKQLIPNNKNCFGFYGSIITFSNERNINILFNFNFITEYSIYSAHDKQKYYDILNFITKHKTFKWNINDMRNIIIKCKHNKTINIINIMRSGTYIWNSSLYIEAYKYNRYDVFKYLFDNNCPIDKSIIKYIFNFKTANLFDKFTPNCVKIMNYCNDYCPQYINNDICTKFIKLFDAPKIMSKKFKILSLTNTLEVIFWNNFKENNFNDYINFDKYIHIIAKLYKKFEQLEYSFTCSSISDMKKYKKSIDREKNEK